MYLPEPKDSSGKQGVFSIADGNEAGLLVIHSALEPRFSLFFPSLSEERQIFHMLRHTAPDLLVFFNPYHSLLLTCLFVFTCTVALDKGYFSNLPIRAESS